MAYRQIRRLGAGFFGEVWLEHDEALDRLCAAKYLDPAYLSSTADVYAEARVMMAAAHHENVVTVFSADDNAGTPVIRMEYLPQGSVADRYHGAPVPVGRAVRVMEDTCRGLEHLHLIGLLHRDIKPANLLMTAGGGVKVSDFGLSCKVADASQATSMAYALHLPPEAVATGEGITTVAGDVYAAGVTAYRLINGDTMSQAAHWADLNVVIAAGRYPDRSQWQPYVHTKLRRVITKVLHRDPAKRHPSAASFRRALEQARPAVSWLAAAPGALQWNGEAADGTAWKAAIAASRAESRFTISRRLPGRGWRRSSADARDAKTPEALMVHAADVLGRVAAEGA